MSDSSHRCPSSAGLSRRALLLLLAGGAATSGCINFTSMMGKMFLGDPQIDCSFRQRTGVKLGEKNHVILYSTAPVSVSDENASLTYDVTVQLSRKFHLRGIDVIDPNAVLRAIDKKGGTPNPQSLAREFPEADYIIHIKFGGYGVKEPNSANLYRGYAAGMLFAWRINPESRGTSQIFENEFQVEHPTHPVSRDSMSINAFEKQFVDRLSDELGHVFYDFRTSEML